MRILTLPLLVVAGLALTPPASAGDRTPVSALPKLPPTRDRSEPPSETEELRVRGVSITNVGKGNYANLEARTKDGYCLVNRTYGLKLQDAGGFDDDMTEVWGFRETATSLKVEIVHLGKVNEPRGVWAKSRASVEAVPLGRQQGVAVWGFRDSNGDAVVVARAAVDGKEARAAGPDEGFAFQNAWSTCAYGAVRISAPFLRTGGVAQLRGDPERPDGRFLVDISAAKLSRDPEPVLSLRVRGETRETR